MQESNESKEISIKIQTLDNAFSLKINPAETILALKEKITKKYNIPIDKQRLIFQGKFLKENETLSNYKITDGCVIQLIAKSLEENNNQNRPQQNNRQNNNERYNEVYPIIQIPFRTNRRRRRVVMPHFDISEYLEGFYQNIITLDNFNKCRKNFTYNNSGSPIEAFDFSKSTYEIGEWVDVKDTINQWLEAQIIKVQNNKAYVHYNGWGTRWDEWIDFSSPRMRNFKTYTLQSPLAFCVSPYPAIPCDSNMEPQERPIDIFFYIEKTKDYLTNVLEELNKLISLRKKNIPIFADNKFNIENYEILFRVTQMIPFLDRVGRMLSDISLLFSHFIVNPNYYSSFLFGYKRQDLFEEYNKLRNNNKVSEKINEIFDDKDDKNEINTNTKNMDTQTPPLENKFLKKIQTESQPKPKNKTPKKSPIKKNNNEDLNKINDKEKDKKENINKIEDRIEDKKEKNINKINSSPKSSNNTENKIDDQKDKDKDKEKNKKEEKSDIKNMSEKIKENFNNENNSIHHRHNSYTAHPMQEDEENMNSANFQRQRQRGAQEEIQPNQIATNLGYDLSFSTVELPFIQRIIYSYTLSDRIISPFSPFYQIFVNKRLFPRVNLQIPTILPPGEVMMMTGYSPFSETNFDIYIHTIAVNPNNRNENGENNNDSNNNNNNNNSNNNNNNNNNIINSNTNNSINNNTINNTNRNVNNSCSNIQ